MTVIPLGGQPQRTPGRASAGRSRRTPLLYEEVIDLVQQLIAQDDLKPGDKLPSQRELAEMANVSLITVRRALEELEHEGRVRRHQGLGTFLSGPKILSDPSRAGRLAGTLSTMGSTTGSATASDAGESDRVGTELLGVTRCLPSPDVAAALELANGQQVWEVRRVRTIADKASIAERALIPVHLTPDLDQVYSGGSLYDTLQVSYGLIDDYEEQVLDVVHPDAEVRSLLHLGARSLVVRIQGLSRDKLNVPFDCFEQVYSASEFAFAISGQTERRLQRVGTSRDWSARPVAGSSG